MLGGLEILRIERRSCGRRDLLLGTTTTTTTTIAVGVVQSAV